MLTDFRAGQLRQLDADLCIVGAGAAGITSWRGIRGPAPLGDRSRGGASRSTSRCRTCTPASTRAKTSRFRPRDSACSAVRASGADGAPLDGLDFERRDWVADSGWPIARSDLLDCYARAQQVCQLGRFRCRPEWQTSLPERWRRPAKLEHRLWQLSPLARFGALYRDELDRARNVRVVLNASATEIVTGENGAAARYVQIASLDGRRAQVRAKAYVLACGHRDPAFAADVEASRTGRTGQRPRPRRPVFHGAPAPDAGGVLLSGDPHRSALCRHRGRQRQVVLGFSPAQLRSAVCGSSFEYRRNGPLHHEPSEAWDSLMKLLRAVGSRQWPKDAGTLCRGCAARPRRCAARAICAQRTPARGFSFTHRDGTLASNRITLEESAMRSACIGCDSTGAGSLERVTVERTMQLLAEELGRLDIGRVRINELLMEDDTRWSENLSWFGHHGHDPDEQRSGIGRRGCGPPHPRREQRLRGERSVFPRPGLPIRL
jgi:hypothetical protein